MARTSLLTAVVAFLLAVLVLAPRTSGQVPSLPAFTAVASILEVMVHVVDPAADAIWESVSIVVTASGSTETRPRTEEEWLALRQPALILAEAGNLLKISRPVVPARAIPGIQPEPPGPDDLSPGEIEALLKQNRTPFNGFAQKLTDAALVAVRAVDDRSVDGLYEAGDVIDQACESCHMAYWYPPKPGQTR